MTPAQTFDALAPAYDRRWTRSAVGRRQRGAFWKCADPYFKGARRVLDLGCGTGQDALRLMRRGVSVTAIDISPEMIAIARSRGVDARVLAIEDLALLDGEFDVVLSNFGAVNCVPHLDASALARLLRPGGYFLACVLGRFCLWEAMWFASHGDFKSAARRWRGRARTSSGLRVFYPAVREIRRSLSPHFRLIAQAGIGICVPPSYVSLPRRVLSRAGRIDRAIAANPGLRALADHTLLVFERS